MANYHMSIKIFSRGKGASAVQKAAYRAADKFKSEYDGEIHDYTKKKGVIHTEILLPENALDEYINREILWNSVEQNERYINAQLAREIEISLPNELTQQQNIELARKFAQEVLVDEGMVADICVHDKNDGNIHAHIMCSMRPINEDGTWGQKSQRVDGIKVPTVDWNDREKSEYWRRKWAEYQNEALKKYNHQARVDHRSYQRQEIEQVPTVHLGPEATWMERRGIRTERGDNNRDIIITNKELAQLKARINKLKKWLYSQPLHDAPLMSDVLKSIADSQQLASRAKKIANLKALANVVNFLKENNISSIDQLTDKVASMHQQRYDLAGTVKKQERRISTLDKHIEQAELNKRTLPIYRQYISLDPKKQATFKERYAAEIRQYEESHQYLTAVLNGRTKVPEKEWRAERDQLLRERYELVEQYYELKEDVRNTETLCRHAGKLMTTGEQEQAPPEQTQPSRTRKQEEL